MGFLMLVLSSSEAAAATAPSIATPIAVVAPASDTIKLPAPQPASALGIANAIPTPLTRGTTASIAQPSIAATLSPVAVLPAQFRQTLPLAQPLHALVEAYSTGPALDSEANCLATAVYFESMGEPLEGQLAVARVVLNRAASGRYPATWCGVVKQKAQFSFVRAGRFPRVDAGCQAWRKAQAIARIAMANAAASLPADVLWYHADYVAPSWGRRLTKVEKIGAHIFYRA
ncbi:cell wall hydrolase [Sphingomonas sp.]|uniref:cell wall hydrolase n=1 Tax=Sphingomonas sp. TaxID=28214 RepID=UPI00286E9059|nr:cell wall hydrolase [Sphingomonas sp.]